MKECYKDLIRQLAKSASDGIFGEATQSLTDNYNQIPEDIPKLLKFLLNTFQEISTQNDEISYARDYFCKIFITIYREVKKNDFLIAQAYTNSFIYDYPGIPNTALVSRWNSLAHASFAFKSVAHSNDPLLIWQQSSQLFLSYNEFLNGLLGYLIISWRCVLGKKINPNVFSSSYGVKAKQFEELTEGEKGIFYLFHRIIKPSIRNAIAHGTAWLDREQNKVRYTDKSSGSNENEIDLLEFLAFSTFGSHLASSYIAAFSAIVIWENGNSNQIDSLPQQLIKLLSG
jgi:hypothetical protein